MSDLAVVLSGVHAAAGLIDEAVGIIKALQLRSGRALFQFDLTRLQRVVISQRVHRSIPKRLR